MTLTSDAADDDELSAVSEPDVSAAACADVCFSNSLPSMPAFSAITVCRRSLSAFSEAISL